LPGGGALFYARLQLFDKSEKKSGLLGRHIDSEMHENVLFKYTVVIQCITLTIVARSDGLKICNTAATEDERIARPKLAGGVAIGTQSDGMFKPSGHELLFHKYCGPQPHVILVLLFQRAVTVTFGVTADRSGLIIQAGLLHGCLRGARLNTQEKHCSGNVLVVSGQNIGLKRPSLRLVVEFARVSAGLSDY
jgi:hypothetical protein